MSPPNVPFGDSGSLKQHLGWTKKAQLVCANFIRGDKYSNICQLVMRMMAVSHMPNPHYRKIIIGTAIEEMTKYLGVNTAIFIGWVVGLFGLAVKITELIHR